MKGFRLAVILRIRLYEPTRSAVLFRVVNCSEPHRYLPKQALAPTSQWLTRVYVSTDTPSSGRGGGVSGSIIRVGNGMNRMCTSARGGGDTATQSSLRGSECRWACPFRAETPCWRCAGGMLAPLGFLISRLTSLTPKRRQSQGTTHVLPWLFYLYLLAAYCPCVTSRGV